MSAMNQTLPSSSSSASEAAVPLLLPNDHDHDGSGGVAVKAVITIRKKMKESVTEKIGDQWEHFFGDGISVQLISDDIDPVTKLGKRAKFQVKDQRLKPSANNPTPNVVKYCANFTVPVDFGVPGAVSVTNFRGKEFFLVEIMVHGFNNDETYFFPANTWIHSSTKGNPESRIIFRNQAYLPSQTPSGIEALRREDLLSLRGNGDGERKPHERIYDYDVYNDLGSLDDGKDRVRPILGGSDEFPFPRRCRTGRPPAKKDKSRENRIGTFYVPRDEGFGEVKEKALAAVKLEAAFHNVIPAISDFLAGGDAPFSSLSDVDTLYNDGYLIGEDEPKWFVHQFLVNVWNSWHRLMKFDIPVVIKGDRFSWLRDEEFARQMLAGVNPMTIRLLREFPIASKLDPAVYGPPESALTKEVIERDLQEMSLEKAIEEKRLFILDHHDIILPFVHNANSSPGMKTYASRTVFYLNKAGVLRPLAIELSLPPASSSSAGTKRVLTPGDDVTTQWMWKLAKAHVWPNDASIHQVVNHLLRTHLCTEPYIISMHRQLSVMHPIYKLLYPHMRYTLAVNAFTRQILINGGGLLEDSYIPGKSAMGLSSAAYKAMWRFDMEALPADLLRRGMSVEDPSMPCGVRLVIEDYPYASDGLLIWSAIKEWVEAYLDHFYSDPNSVKSDFELQAWWDEIRNIGHADKRNEPWWPNLHTNEDLSGILTTMIWMTSGHHAAINFSQYPFGGYVLNRPTFMRRLIPQKDDPDYEKFILNPEEFFLSSLPTKFQASKVLATQDSVSYHSPDEEYLGQPNSSGSNWINDEDIKKLCSKFTYKLEEVEKTINLRNKDIQLKNRSGTGVPPYEQLLPTSEPGVTGRGVPKSISA